MEDLEVDWDEVARTGAELRRLGWFEGFAADQSMLNRSAVALAGHHGNICSLAGRADRNYDEQPMLRSELRPSKPGNENAGPCRESLCTGAPLSLPNHVCRDTILETVEHFAALLFPPRNDDERMWLNQWPLPVGERSIAKFALSHRIDRRNLPHPLWEDLPDACIGIWLERHPPQGSVRLFGLAEYFVAEDEPDDIGGINIRYEWWNFTVARVQIDCLAGQSQNSALIAIERDLHAWYQERILAVSAQARVGRPKRSLAMSVGELERKYSDAVETCIRFNAMRGKSQKRNITNVWVAELMSIGGSSLRNYIATGTLIPLKEMVERLQSTHMDK